MVISNIKTPEEVLLKQLMAAKDFADENGIRLVIGVQQNQEEPLNGVALIASDDALFVAGVIQAYLGIPSITNAVIQLSKQQQENAMPKIIGSDWASQMGD